MSLKNIAILSVQAEISEAQFLDIQKQFKNVRFTLIAPKSCEIWTSNHTNVEHWHDGDRTGFLKLLTIARRMSWCSFDCVLHLGSSFKDKTLLALLWPKPEIRRLQKHTFLRAN